MIPSHLRQSYSQNIATESTVQEKSKSRIQIVDDLVKSLKRQISVIPAKFPMPRLGAWHPRMDENGSFSNEAGIQLFQILKNSLDSGFHRCDDFLRDHQN